MHDYMCNAQQLHQLIIRHLTILKWVPYSPKKNHLDLYGQWTKSSTAMILFTWFD